MDGLEICRQIRRFNENIPVIFCSADVRTKAKEAAMEAGAQSYFFKPIDVQEFKEAVIRLIKESTNNSE